MKYIHIIIATALIVTFGQHAAAYTGYGSISSTPPADATYDYDYGKYGKVEGVRSAKAKRRIKIGGLMLGIGWAVPAVVGFICLDSGSRGLGARMLIPYHGLAEVGTMVARDSSLIMPAIPMFIPSIVQLVGTGLLISGAVDKRKSKISRFAAAPVIYKNGGGGVGVSFAM